MNENAKKFFIVISIIALMIFLWINAFLSKIEWVKKQNAIVKTTVSDTLIYTAITNKDLFKLSTFTRVDDGLEFNTDELLYAKSIDELVNNWTSNIQLKNKDKAIIFVVDENKTNSWVDVLDKNWYEQLNEDLDTGFITNTIISNSKFFQTPVSINGTLTWYLIKTN